MDADGRADAGIDALPGDILEDILRRLRAHSLARCRGVCAPWRALVDGRGLLLPHALPRAFPGFLANVVRAEPWRPGPGFLPPPAARGPDDDDVDRLAFLRPHLPRGGGEAAAQHHCGGLVLCFQDRWIVGGGGEPRAGFVCNPTTRRWARLPPPPAWWPRDHEGLFLAFDPAASLDYEVLLLPVPPPSRGVREDAGHARGPVTLGMFVPESFGKQHESASGGDVKALPLLVFSSATGRWRRRPLAPGRCAPARLYDRVMRRHRRTSEGDPWVRTWRSAVYCHGALYAHCEKRILVVLRSSEGTYDMVKLPSGAGAGAGEHYAAEHVLSGLPVDSIFSSAEEGVLLRYASVYACRVKVWALQESADDGGGQLEWTLTHDKDLAAHARMLELLHDAPSNCVPLATEGRRHGSNNDRCVWFSDEDAEEVGNNGGARDGCGLAGQWNWDDASLLDMETGGDDPQHGIVAAPSPFVIPGCHPSKEVIFLAAGAFHVVAYHLGTGKVQYMGRVMSLGDGDRVEGVFPYRPCIVDALPRDNCLFPSLKIANKRR